MLCSPPQPFLSVLKLNGRPRAARKDTGRVAEKDGASFEAAPIGKDSENSSPIIKTHTSRFH